MEEANQQSQSPQPANPTTPTVNSGKSKVIPIILGVAAAIVIAIGAYLLGTKQTQPVVQNQQSSVVPTAIPTPIADPTANWKTYIFNNEFSLKYPSEWKAGDLKEICCSYISAPSPDYSQNSEGTLNIQGVYGATCKEEVSKIKNLETIFAGNPAHVAEGMFNVDPLDKNSPLTNTKTVFVHKGNACYTLTYSSISQKQVFDQILSTFRFTP